MSDPEDKKLIGMIGAIGTAGRISSAVIGVALATVKKELTAATQEGEDLNPQAAEMVVAVALIINALMLIEDHPVMSPERLLRLAQHTKQLLEESGGITKKTDPKLSPGFQNAVKEALDNERAKGPRTGKKEAPEKANGFLSDEELGKMFNFDQEN